jgi:uncharacterized membrane protein
VSTPPTSAGTGTPPGRRIRSASALRRRVRGEHPDGGQLLLLVLAYLGIAAALIGVVVDASAVFLAQRALSATADGAALAAAQTLDERQVYAAGVPLDRLPLSPSGVAAAAAAYLDDDGAPRRFDELTLGTATDGTTATVTLGTAVELPFSGGFLGVRGPAALRVVASARSPLR